MDKKITELKNLFQVSGFTLTEISKQTNIPVSTVSRYVKGEITKIKEDYYKAIYNVVTKKVSEITRVKQTQEQVDKIKNGVLLDNQVANQQKFPNQCNMNYNRYPKRGDVYYIKNNHASQGEMWGSRPAVILSNNKLNEYSNTVMVCYLTSKEKKPMPTHIDIKSNRETSIALCENVYTISKDRLERYFFKVSDEELSKIDLALVVGLDIKTNNRSNNQSYEVLKAERDFYKNFYDTTMKINMIRAESYLLSERSM